MNIKDTVLWNVTPGESLGTTVISFFKVKESTWRNECGGRNVLGEGYRPTSDKGLNENEAFKCVLNKLIERRWTKPRCNSGGRNEEVLLTVKWVSS